MLQAECTFNKKSSELCTFGTPFGRYRFKRLLFGIKTASDVFQERFQEMFEQNGVKIYVDDILMGVIELNMTQGYEKF